MGRLVPSSWDRCPVRDRDRRMNVALPIRPVESDGAPDGRPSRGSDPWIAISSRRRNAGTRRHIVDLIRARSDRLFAIAQRILRDVDRAEDALQDALVIAWRDLRGLRDPDRFDAWLQRLLINVCIAQATRERRRTANLRVLPVDGPAGSRRPAQRGRPGPARTRVPAAAARSAGDPRAPSLPRVRALRDRRDARHPGRHGPLATPSRPSRHARRPRRGRRDHGPEGRPA